MAKGKSPETGANSTAKQLHTVQRFIPLLAPQRMSCFVVANSSMASNQPNDWPVRREQKASMANRGAFKPWTNVYI